MSTITANEGEPIPAVADFILVGAYVVLADVLVVTLPAGSVTRAAAALPLLCFIPGYAVVTALYPRRADAEPTSSPSDDPLGTEATTRPLGTSVGWVERGVFSVALSVGVLAVLGVVLSLLGVELTAGWTLLWSLEAVVVAGLAVGLVRRLRLPAVERFRLSHEVSVEPLSRAFASRPWADRALNLVLVVLVVGAVGGLTVGLVSHTSAEQYTTLSLVTENEAGEYVTGDFPRDLTAGETASLVVSVENHEGSGAEYTVVPVLQRVEQSDRSASVVERQRLSALQVAPGEGEVVYERHDFTPELTGTDLRLVYLLYEGDPPENPTTTTAERHAHIWVDVSAEGEQ